MGKKVKIVAFLGIFEQRLSHLIKDIKKHKKAGNKEHTKRLLKDAKALRDIVRDAAEDRKDST